jgi:sulfide dehydrogenase cytochrome subunit
MKFVTKSLLALLLGLPGAALAADQGELIAECDSCHGPGGASANSEVPTIGGQSAEFISDTLRSFQVWGRPCVKTNYPGDSSRPRTDMCKIAGGLSEEDVSALSEHYGKQSFVAASQEFDIAKAEAGAILHSERCETCHEQGGRVAARGPRLAGQWVPYMKATLKFVPTGEHMVPPMMERGIGKFSDQEIDQLMNFYASQQD